MYLQKSNKQKNYIKNYFFVGVLKVNDENRRSDPDLDPSVRDMDRRIRIHTKMSWIRNTAFQ